MRTPLVAALGVLIVAAACSRPVLYYPTPETVPGAVARPAASGKVPLSTVGESPAAMAALSDIEYLSYRRILLPVAGASVAKLEDTFNEGRDGDRTHHAIDILAPRGTPILSADDGRILRMTSNSLGGITVYAVDPQNRLVYYYAHLDHYNDAMSPGRTIVRGDTLGFVGTTGNAPKDIPHLHFQVMRWPADGKYWNGEPIDPYDALGGTPRNERAKHVSSQPYEY